MAAHNHAPSNTCPEHKNDEGFIIGACMDDPIRALQEHLDPRLDMNLIHIMDRTSPHKLTLSDTVGSVWVHSNGIIVKHKYTDFRVSIGSDAHMGGEFDDTGEPWIIHLPPEILAAAERQNIEIFRKSNSDFSYVTHPKKEQL